MSPPPPLSRNEASSLPNVPRSPPQSATLSSATRGPVGPRQDSKFINPNLYEEGVEVGFVKDDTSCLTKAYVKCCYYLPITCISVMMAYFVYLCIYDRPLCLALLTVYMIHHSYCYLYHVTLFSWIGQSRMRKAELVNYRELYVRGKSDFPYISLKLNDDT